MFWVFFLGDAATPLLNSRSSPPCMNPSRSYPVWVIPREINSLFSGFGEGKVQGKEEMSEKQEYKKDTRLDKKKTERGCPKHWKKHTGKI